MGAKTYWNLLEKVPPRDLKLTKYETRFTLSLLLISIPLCRLDDEIYEDTMKTFPEFAESSYAKLIKLDEDWLKSPEGKERWRKFIQSYVWRISIVVPLMNLIISSATKTRSRTTTSVPSFEQMQKRNMGSRTQFLASLFERHGFCLANSFLVTRIQVRGPQCRLAPCSC
jgi:hypothetical protein